MKTQELYEVAKEVQKHGARSQWKKGVLEYAVELAEQLCEYREETSKIFLQTHLLNGAISWKEYSWGGNSLIYNEDIAKRLATKSEIKSRTNKAGHLNSWANAKEQWLDVQARALYQAYRELKDIVIVWDNAW